MIAITESFGGYLRAGLTGLGGIYTGGPLSSFYDNRKEQAAQQAAALRSGNPYEMYNSDTAGKHLLYNLGGSIPLVGSITNMMAYSDRMDAEKKANLMGQWGRSYKRQD